jgi:hypothetical protein
LHLLSFSVDKHLADSEIVPDVVIVILTSFIMMLKALHPLFCLQEEKSNGLDFHSLMRTLLFLKDQGLSWAYFIIF